MSVKAMKVYDLYMEKVRSGHVLDQTELDAQMDKADLTAKQPIQFTRETAEAVQTEVRQRNNQAAELEARNHRINQKAKELTTGWYMKEGAPDSTHRFGTWR